MRRTDRERETPRRRLPPLLHLLGTHLVLGAALGVAVVSMMVFFNLAGLKELITETEDPVVPLVLLYAFNVLTFSSVSMGIAIMTMPADEG